MQKGMFCTKQKTVLQYTATYEFTHSMAIKRKNLTDSCQAFL